MNKDIIHSIEDERVSRRTDGKIINKRTKEVLLLTLLAVLLIVLAWVIFHFGDSTTETTYISTNKKEEKIIRLLQEIDGVGEVSVVVCETEDGVQGAVVVCEGANDFQVVMNVRGAVAAALGTEEKSIKIYLKN